MRTNHGHPIIDSFLLLINTFVVLNFLLLVL
jgi:hypothetical protein